MANKFPDQSNGKISIFDERKKTDVLLGDTPSSNLKSVRQLSDSRTPTARFLVFENSNSDWNEIRFWEYLGTRNRNHHTQRLYLPQLIRKNEQTESSPSYKEFSNCIREVLSHIPLNELPSYVISVRTGVTYFFSKCFRFNQSYSMDEIHQLVEKNIPSTDNRYYVQRTYRTDGFLRSSFSNVKPISKHQDFVHELETYQFYVKQQKHVFRVYLQSEDKQTHVCVVDPSANYSIIEFSKDFQRNSNIGKLLSRSAS